MRCIICDWVEGEGPSSLFSQSIPHSKDNSVNEHTSICLDCTSQMPIPGPRKAVQQRIAFPGTQVAKLKDDAPAPLLDPLFDEA